MASRYFLISETGDGGAWLVDTEVRTVERIEADALESGASVPDSDIVANLKELRGDGGFTVIRGIGLAIAATSLSGPSGHKRREGGGD